MAPIKNKYDGALSCGDLMVLSGYDAVILPGGCPLNHVCAGRIDQTNSRDDSVVLNTDESCDIKGNCGDSLDSSTVGLIYGNPERFLGVPDQERTETQVFVKMDMNDLEAAALIRVRSNQMKNPFNPLPVYVVMI